VTIPHKCQKCDGRGWYQNATLESIHSLKSLGEIAVSGIKKCSACEGGLIWWSDQMTKPGAHSRVSWYGNVIHEA